MNIVQHTFQCSNSGGEQQTVPRVWWGGGADGKYKYKYKKYFKIEFICSDVSGTGTSLMKWSVKCEWINFDENKARFNLKRIFLTLN